ncbi:MAG: hypothetical protein KAJ95_09435 [Gammaproteobacteria bacterium]|nr:hypothetical protein [Gammaproteobacteria bacterium]
MNNISKDDGIITVMLLRLKQQRLPRIFAMHEKVLRGDLLDDYDINFLDSVCCEARNCHLLCQQHPEFNDLFSRITHFYHEIALAALENEKHRSLH